MAAAELGNHPAVMDDMAKHVSSVNREQRIRQRRRGSESRNEWLNGDKTRDKTLGRRSLSFRTDKFLYATVGDGEGSATSE